MNYTDLINIFNSRNEDGANMWNFENIVGQRKVTDNDLEVKVM